MAREEENSAISLFSFQDIITSLTGIMFLVVLMLLLVVLSPHGFLQSEVDPDTKALQKEVQSLRAELDKLSGSSEALMRELEKLNSLSESELIARLDDARAKFAQLKRKADADAQQTLALDTRSKELRKELEELRSVNETLTAVLPPLESEVAKLKQESEAAAGDLRRREKVVNFTVTRAPGKTPQLLELSADGVRLLAPDSGREEDFRVPGNGKASLVRFAGYLAQHRGENIYFSVVTRPDGFQWGKILLNMLSKAGFERGIEILPSNDVSIFDEVTP